LGYDFLVVGAGFAGSVMAERLAARRKRVLVIDRRPHIGGNAFDELDAAGVRVHRYGPHIFHTNAPRIFTYLSRFTEWRPYEHRVLACVRDRLVPIPINRTTINSLYGLQLPDDDAVEAFYQSRAEARSPVETSEDAVVNRAGRELFELFFRGYTRKQWGLEPRQLDASVSSRVPLRTNEDDRYFTDRIQAMPADGYTRMFERMLGRPGIDVLLDTDFETAREKVDYDRVVYTGPVDEYFGRRYGALPYRSLEFRFTTLPERRVLPTATVNFPDESIPFTRITEFTQLTGQELESSTLVVEYPRATGDPYYPIPRPENAELYARYKQLADAQSEAIFVGRLATYRYYNMDQVVAQALSTADRILRAGQRAA
jgi:UDP-galactopyranose mutase